ncbi:cell envelope biogenesis protein OmpA, partial [Sphingobacteriales bacterium UPWRP_1]
MKNFKTQLLLLCGAVLCSGSLFAQSDGDLPPNAVAGKCYAKCLIPDQYETVTEQILLKEAGSRIEVVPAVYETANEQLLVKEG